MKLEDVSELFTHLVSARIAHVTLDHEPCEAPVALDGSHGSAAGESWDDTDVEVEVGLLRLR
jgi:hypothetical protein